METEPIIFIFELSLFFFFLVVFAVALKTVLDYVWFQVCKLLQKEDEQ